MYHLISRGDQKEAIFAGDGNKTYFVQALEEGATRYHIDVFAFCIMDTHYHLQVQINETNLSEFMHFLGSSYANYLVRKGWLGHVFSGRYKSIVIDQEEYLLEVNRYIHLNPVAAAIARRPEDYRWSSYRDYLGLVRPFPWVWKGWLAEHFGAGASEALGRYQAFIMEGMAEPSYYPNDKVIARCILGGERFIRGLMERISEDERAGLERMLGTRPISHMISLSELYDAVCEHFNLDKPIAGEDGRVKAYRHACDLFIYMARLYTLASNGNIAELVGISRSNTISHRYAGIRRRLEEDPSYEERVKVEARRVLARIANERNGDAG